jgi:hypothetical protein
MPFVAEQQSNIHNPQNHEGGQRWPPFLFWSITAPRLPLDVIAVGHAVFGIDDEQRMAGAPRPWFGKWRKA